MYNYKKTQDFLHDLTKLGIQYILRREADLTSNSSQICKKMVPCDDIVHFIVKENIMAFEEFDCGNTFYPEAPTKVGPINREPKKIPDRVKNPGASQVTINITVLMMRSIPVISF